MIHVPRPLLPSDLQDHLASKSRELLEGISALDNRQVRPEFDAAVWNSVKREAAELFHGKCALCETPLAATAPMDIEHFRPKLGAMSLDKRQDPLYYAWLAYDWDNLYIVCYYCSRNKRAQFPLRGQRGEFGASVAELRTTEEALLIDPCDPADRPEHHLSFDIETGGVLPLSDKGVTTSDILGLNRESLRMARLQTMRLVTAFRAAGRPDEVDRLTADAAPYAAAARAALLPRKTQVAVPASARMAKGAPVAGAETGYITSIRIERFRGIRDVSLTIEPGSGNSAGWLMLLGENGAGKSSILQAVALALLGSKHLDAVPQTTKWDDLLMNGENQGRVRLKLTARPLEIEVQLKRGETPRFTKGSAGCPSLVLGYGPVRLPGDSAGDPKRQQTVADRRVASLFDHRTPLTSPEAWLTKLTTEEFDFTARTLRDLLHLRRADDAFAVVDQRVELHQGKSRVRLDQVSAGFGAVIALAVDIMQAAPAVMVDKKDTAGIVLLDEVDAHLHPRWKMEIVRRLREAFPNLQFIACTHEPLCLRGLRDHEAVVIGRDESGQVRITDKRLPSPASMRIDQLLTSPFFGLHTTIDPEVEEVFRRYYEILFKPEADRSDDEKKRLTEFARVVERHGVLGYTRRDRLVYEVIDDFLAKEGTLGEEARAKLKDKTKEKVLKLWRSADSWLERRS